MNNLCKEGGFVGEIQKREIYFSLDGDIAKREIGRVANYIV